MDASLDIEDQQQVNNQAITITIVTLVNQPNSMASSTASPHPPGHFSHSHTYMSTLILYISDTKNFILIIHIFFSFHLTGSTLLFCLFSHAAIHIYVFGNIQKEFCMNCQNLDKLLLYEASIKKLVGILHRKRMHLHDTNEIQQTIMQMEWEVLHVTYFSFLSLSDSCFLLV